MRGLYFLLLIASYGMAMPDVNNCIDIFNQSSLLSATYDARIAHGIHSLTLNDIQKYFNPMANETNNIPTINRNLTSPIPILNDAPKLNKTSQFTTTGLQVAEEVLSHEGEIDWDSHNSDSIDKLIHALHMHDMWESSSQIYKRLVTKPPSNLQLCPCLIDVENNGIYYHLRRIAMLIREPELTYNKENKRTPRSLSTSALRMRGHYSGTYSVGHAPERKKRETHLNEDVDNDDTAEFHSRNYWGKLFKDFGKDMTGLHNDLALFLFCMLE